MVDFTTFKDTLKGDIVEPDAADYPAAISRWAVNAQRKARHVVFPKDEADVSLTVKFATSNGIRLAIKGGGHNSSGASSIEDGLAYVGGGATWATVDRATIAHGLATPGGTMNETGVGGLTLGGGYGWLSGQYGLVIDNLVQATVVTADGSVLTASDTSHPDLFWGIRGGGSNFGVVTEFVLKVYPQNKTVFAGPLIFAPPMLGAVVEAVEKWWSAGPGEKEGLVMALTRGPERQPVVVLTLFFNGSAEEGRANYRQFYDLGPAMALAAEMPYENLNDMFNADAGRRRHYYMSGTSLRSQISSHANDIFGRVVSASVPQPGSDLPPHDVMVGYEMLRVKKICEVPPDATAFRSRGPQVNVVFVISWDKENAEEKGLEYARTTSRELASIIEGTQEREPKENENEGYGNYVADLSAMPSRIRRMWGENYPRLQQIKKVYDPSVVFDRWFAIQPVA